MNAVLGLVKGARMTSRAVLGRALWAMQVFDIELAQGREKRGEALPLSEFLRLVNIERTARLAKAIEKQKTGKGVKDLKGKRKGGGRGGLTNGSLSVGKVRLKKRRGFEIRQGSSAPREDRESRRGA